MHKQILGVLTRWCLLDHNKTSKAKWGDLVNPKLGWKWIQPSFSKGNIYIPTGIYRVRIPGNIAGKSFRVSLVTKKEIDIFVAVANMATCI